jgi:hypothetical protein
MRIESLFDVLHHPDRVCTELFDERILLAETDAVFTGACAFHLKCTIYHVVDHLLNRRSFLGVLAVIENALVEVTVADVA